MDPERLLSWWEGRGWDLEPEGEQTQDREGNFPVVTGKIDRKAGADGSIFGAEK